MAQKTKQEKVHCNECRRKTDHRLLKSGTGDCGSEEHDEYSTVFWETRFDLFQCCGCLEMVLRRTYHFSEDDGFDIRYFPPRVSRHLPPWAYELPYNIKSVLEEVYRSLDADNRRLPLMGARAILDIVMVEKIGDIGGFGQKLEALEDRGFVSSKNREVLNAALDAGSAAAHRGYFAKSVDVNTVMDIVENLLQAVYVLQEAAEQLKKSTPARPRSRTPSSRRKAQNS
jgi:hypothetical protein